MRISVLCQDFENFTVVASALVAEFGRRAPAQNRVPNTGMQVQVLPSALLCHAPVAQLEEAPILDAGQCGFESYQAYNGVVGENVYHSWLLPMSSGFEPRATHARAVS